MTNSKKKNPAEELIKSVIDELQTSASNSVDSESTSLLQEHQKKKAEAAEPQKHQASSVSIARPGGKHLASGNSAMDAHLVQAENLKLAQNRLNEFEKELEKLRGENESLYSATEVAKDQVEQLSSKVLRLERQSKDDHDTHEQELEIYKNSLSEKDAENLRLRQKVQEMEARLSADLKKIRVRERELENRLELSKLEKSALVRSKDETILDLQRKIDQLTHELDAYKNRCVDLNEKIEGHHDQLSRTVRALRLALTNLEVNENTGVTIAPIKKAE
jgi:chromosome segregation ATPase